jgi:hypothetical protein
MLLRTRPEVPTSMNLMYVATQILLQILPVDYPSGRSCAVERALSRLRKR